MKALTVMLVGALAGCASHSVILAPTAVTPPLERRYREGERLAYRITSEHTTDGRLDGSTEAHAVTVVKKNSKGAFFEEVQWVRLERNGAPIELPLEGLKLRQRVSLDPGFPLAVPLGLQQAPPPLVAPVLGLMALYADTQLALRAGLLRNAGDHGEVKSPVSRQWEGGEDCVDFQVSLTSVDAAADVATLQVERVPPAEGCIQPPAPWMVQSVTGVPNNWYQVKQDGARWRAQTGEARNHDQIQLVLSTGAIRSATLSSPVELVSADCSDPELLVCSEPLRHRLNRKLQIALEAQ